jgi:ketose-bisphosphate aldolase
MKGSLLNIIRREVKAGRAVVAFNVFNYATAAGVLAAGAELEKPMILQISQSVVERYGASYLLRMVEAAAHTFDVEYAVHLDHATDLQLIKTCIDCGFSSVMYDGSSLPLPENITETKQVIRAARGRGIAVEGEVGVIGGDQDVERRGKSALPTLEEVASYVASTNVDLVAVALGNRHGHYDTPNPVLDFGLLSLCAGRVNVPLVLHGGTGLSRECLMRLMELGIRKINISTRIKEVYCEAFVGSMEELGADYLRVDSHCTACVSQSVSEFYKMIELC